jgi:methionyl-tRNA formyltransferase
MRVILFAYHDVGCACLRALLDRGAEVALLVTHDDDPEENVWFGSVRAIAEARGIPVAAPADANAPDFVARLRALAPDVLLSAYFRQILSPEMLAIPKRGAFNMHGSLLPKFRGRAPVNWVLVEGESETGVTLHVMDSKPDRGDIVGQRAIPITDDDTARTLHGKVAAAAGDLLRDLWPAIETGTAPRIPQDPLQSSYRGRRGPEDGRLDFTGPARTCWNLVRAVTHPYPGAFTVADGKKLFVWKARVVQQEDAEPGRIIGVVEGSGVLVGTGNGVLLLETVQIEGDDERRGDELVRGGTVRVGQSLGR